MSVQTAVRQNGTVPSGTVIPVPAEFGVVESKFVAEIEGLTPILMHRPSAMAAASDELKRSGASEIPTPTEEAEAGVYRDDDGLYLPAVAVREAMVGAGTQFKNPAYKKGTLATPLAAALIPPEEEGFTLMRDGEPITDYEVDIRRAVLKNGGRAVAVMRARPRVATPWRTTVVMGFDSGVVAPENLVQVLAHAGSKVGVLDYRPAKRGPFGRFEVKRFEVL